MFRCSEVSSVIVYLKVKFNDFFHKIESSNDSDSDCCITVYKEGDSESSSNRTGR